ncbi:MAG TPA: hypothetical protein VIX12_08480, partial [Candidatus Binataceae bacterium]
VTPITTSEVEPSPRTVEFGRDRGENSDTAIRIVRALAVSVRQAAEVPDYLRTSFVAGRFLRLGGHGIRNLMR